MDGGLDIARDFEILEPTDSYSGRFDGHDGNRFTSLGRHDNEGDGDDVTDGASPLVADSLKCPKCDKRFALEQHLDLLDHFDSHS